MHAKMNSKSVIIKILMILLAQTLQVSPFPQPPETDLIFADKRLALVFPIIQNFKALITSDPFNVTATWVGSNVCDYRGFYCDAPPDNQSSTTLASIDFNGFQLAAPTLAGFLDRLPDIALFHANSNNFAGTVPPATAALPFLYELDLSNNKLSGPFPAALLSMDTTLTFLDLRFNSFSGAVPAHLFGKPSLHVLFINNNDFFTKLPEIIAGGSIHYLTLANNKFFGPIPHGILRALSGSTEIVLLNNLLTGCLPYDVGFLQNAVVLDFGGNRLTGPLPHSLGCLEKAEIVNFAGNLLYGSVPEVVCSLGNVVNLSLSDNYFTHVGHVCWRLIRSGVLDVRRNCIPGLPLQRPVSECGAFFAYPRYCPYWPAHGRIPCPNPHFGLDFPAAPSPS